MIEEMKSVELTIFDGASFAIVPVEIRTRIYDALHKQGIYINAPCSGRGTCGKCRVTVMEGRLLSELGTESECSFVAVGQSSLACRSFVIENCTIDVSNLQERDFAGLANFAAQSVDSVDTGYEMVEYIPTKQTWESGQSITAAICADIKRELTFSPKALRQLANWFTLSQHNKDLAPGEDDHGSVI